MKSKGRRQCKLWQSLAFQKWNGLGNGHYLHWNQINVGGQNVATIRVIRWAIIEVKAGALGHKQET